MKQDLSLLIAEPIEVFLKRPMRTTTSIAGRLDQLLDHSLVVVSTSYPEGIHIPYANISAVIRPSAKKRLSMSMSWPFTDKRSA